MDTLNYHIQLPHFTAMLSFLLVLCILGMLPFWWQMQTIGKHFFLIEEQGKEYGKKTSHTAFSIMELQLTAPLERVLHLVRQMNPKTKETLRMQLRLDGYFMPFLYLGLFFLGGIALRQAYLIEYCAVMENFTTGGRLLATKLPAVEAK